MLCSKEDQTLPVQPDLGHEGGAGDKLDKRSAIVAGLVTFSPCLHLYSHAIAVVRQEDGTGDKRVLRCQLQHRWFK
jgi:hypothetical protein